MTSEKTFFISIASYRDNELYPTLVNMINEAEWPARLHIAVCWQNDDNIQPFQEAGLTLTDQTESGGEKRYTFTLGGAVIHVTSVHYFQSRGACWARHQVEKHYQNEDYFLQLDSHCRFSTHWDTTMITMLEELRAQSTFPVLSSYPPGYVPGDNEDRKQYISRLIFNGFSPEGIVRLSSITFTADSPRRCGYLAAGFIFADGHFVTQVPNDPQIFFLGEEIAMAARAWTHGYDIWSPHRILLWHYYKRESSPKVWSDHNNDARKKGAIEKTWWEHDKISKHRVLSLLNASDTPCELGQYGLGNKRTLQAFQYHIGVDFRERRVHPAVIERQKVNWFEELPAHHQQWRQLLQHTNERVIRIKQHEIDFSRHDIAWWHVGVYSEKNNPLMVKQYSPEAMRRQLKNIDPDTEELRIQFITSYPAPAHSIRICPYIAESGWGELLEKDW